MVGTWCVQAITIETVNKASEVMCVRYWIPNEVGGGCNEVRMGNKWDIQVTDRWKAATVWATEGGCGGAHCNTGPPTGVTQFEITVDGGWSNDYYDISALAGFNLGLTVAPTNPTCASQICTSLSTCQGVVPGGPDRTKACKYGSASYVLTFIK
ncbi:hypothetical protein KP509_02G081700 [Ceratopteris richardii]|nr:hypothetical protein KP509_02G081700 [Ceratopteris richardii]